MARIWCCYGCGTGPQLQLVCTPHQRTSMCLSCTCKKKKKKKKRVMQYAWPCMLGLAFKALPGGYSFLVHSPPNIPQHPYMTLPCSHGSLHAMADTHHHYSPCPQSQTSVPLLMLPCLECHPAVFCQSQNSSSL